MDGVSMIGNADGRMRRTQMDGIPIAQPLTDWDAGCSFRGYCNNNSSKNNVNGPPRSREKQHWGSELAIL